MANIFDVAKYILDQKGNMSTMKLQKLCYYCQAWSLVWDDQPLFQEEFEAWANGPVCKELFYKTKGSYYATPEDETGGEDNLTENEMDTIDVVLNYYAGYNAQYLSQLTHMEDPWKEARGDAIPGEKSEAIITKESMAMYYGSL